MMAELPKYLIECPTYFKYVDHKGRSLAWFKRTDRKDGARCIKYIECGDWDGNATRWTLGREYVIFIPSDMDNYKLHIEPLTDAEAFTAEVQQ